MFGGIRSSATTRTIIARPLMNSGITPATAGCRSSSSGLPDACNGGLVYTSTTERRPAPQPETRRPNQYEHNCYSDQDCLFVPLTEDDRKNSVMGRYCCKTIFGAGTKNSFLAARSNRVF